MVNWAFEKTFLPDPVTISIQSDITFYQFTTNAVDQIISVGEPIICPAAESKFWISIYDNSTSNTTVVGSFLLFDESPSGTGAWGWQFYCLEPGPLAASVHIPTITLVIVQAHMLDTNLLDRHFLDQTDCL